MNLLVLAKGYPPIVGGVENYSKYISDGLSNYHNVRVLTFSLREEEGIESYPKEENVDIKRISPSFNEALDGFKFLLYYILEMVKNRPDLIVATTWKIALPCALMQPLFNIPYTLTAHGAEVTRIRGNNLLMRMMRFVFDKAERVVCVSSFTNQIVKEFTGADPQKCKVVSNGIDMDPINRIEKDKAKDEIGFAGQPVLLSVSRLDKRKGHVQVIKALPGILQKVPDLRYIIVGNGPEKEELQKLVAKLELQESVVFTGYVADEELPLYYSACDVFIMLNTMQDIEDFEGFGFVFAEAGAYGKPAIAGDNSGPREVIDDGDTGYLVDPFDRKEVTEKVTKLLADESLKQEMGEAARSRVNNKFTIDIMVDNLNQILTSV